MAIGRNTIALGWKKRKMTKNKALEMSLELIEQLNMDGWVLADFEPQMYACIAAIKEALSQPVKKQGSCGECGVGGGHALYCVACAEKFVVQTETKDEPVAWGMETDGLIYDVICPAEHKREEGEYTIPLYTTPQRTWVGLTDEEIENVYMDTLNFQQNARALEAKLKEKNES